MSSSTGNIDLSVVVLGYRAEGELRPVVTALRGELEQLGVSFELVLVANYHRDSPDSTAAVARKLAEGRTDTVVVALPKDGAMGWDMRSGLDAARGRLLVVMDGDGQNPPRDAVRAYERLRDAGVDVVKGRRVARHDGLRRRILTVIYNAIFVLLFGTWGLWDINGKPKGFTRRAYDDLKLVSDDWFIDAEIILEAQRRGMKIGEIPVEFAAPRARASFVGGGAVIEFVGNMIRYRLRGRRD